MRRFTKSIPIALLILLCLGAICAQASSTPEAPPKDSPAVPQAKEGEIVLRFDDEEAYERTIVRAIFEEDESISLYHDSFAAHYRLADYDELSAVFAGEPEWSAECIDGPDAGFTLYPYGQEAVLCVEMPEEPAEITYQVSCRWGGQEIHSLAHVCFEYPESLPTGADIPDVIDLTVGEENVISFHLSPQGYSFGDEDRVGLEAGDLSYVTAHWCEGHDLHIIPEWAGYYSGYIAVYSANMYIGKPVIFRIADEDGDVPAPGPWFMDDEYDITWLYGPMRFSIPDGLVAQDYLIGWGLDNPDAMLYYYDTDPVWTVESLSDGLSVYCVPLEEKIACNVFLNSIPEPGDYEMRITCAWGGQSDSVLIRVHYVTYEGALPTGNDLPRVIRMKTDETRFFTGSYLPADIGLEPTVTGLYGFDGVESFWPDNEDRRTCQVTALSPGAGMGYGMVGWVYNLVTEKEVVFIVKDTDETLVLPADTSEIKRDAFAGTTVETVVVNNGCEKIGPRAFADCESLVEIIIPASVTSIAEDAFEGCGSFVINTANAYAQEYADAKGILWINE